MDLFLIARDQLMGFVMISMMVMLFYALMYMTYKKGLWIIKLIAFFFFTALAIDIWGNLETLRLLQNDFNAGHELICYNDTAGLFSNKTSVIKENKLLFVGDRGFNMIDENCESQLTRAKPFNRAEILFISLGVLSMCIGFYVIWRVERSQKIQKQLLQKGDNHDNG
ncbi:MAG: hypothetical protein PHX13_10385 [Thiovulaceae bacterium]|nr:hypothetical protein [Sulfurimonadaceae bacterium]